jgi:hypothetical protein
MWNKKLKAVTFAEVSAPILIVSQWFSQLPVTNIMSRDPHKFEFQWKAVRTIYAIIFMTFEFTEICIAIYKGLFDGITLNYSGEIRVY